MLLSVLSVAMVCPVFVEYFESGLVPRFPTLIVACFLLTAALLSFVVALILDAVKKQSDLAFELSLSRMS